MDRETGRDKPLLGRRTSASRRPLLRAGRSWPSACMSALGSQPAPRGIRVLRSFWGPTQDGHQYRLAHMWRFMPAVGTPWPFHQRQPGFPSGSTPSRALGSGRASRPRASTEPALQPLPPHGRPTVADGCSFTLARLGGATFSPKAGIPAADGIIRSSHGVVGSARLGRLEGAGLNLDRYKGTGDASLVLR